MTTFPGDNTNIPKRLTECLEYQPLNFLVPKSGLCELLRSSLHITPVPDEIVFGEQEAINDTDNERSGPIEPFELKEGLKIHFRAIEPVEGNGKDDSRDLFEGLSEGARDFLNTACLEDFGKRSHSSDDEEYQEKDSRDLNGSNGVERVSVDVELRMSSKKRKAGPREASLDQSAMLSRYVEELNEIVSEIKAIENMSDDTDRMYWTRVDNSRSISDACLERIVIILKNVSKSEEFSGNFDHAALSLLLRACSESIDAILKAEDFSVFTNAAFKCVSIILMVFLLDMEDKRLYLERYLVSAILFLQRVSGDLSEDSRSNIATADNCLQLRSALSLLSFYVHKKSLQEEELITKLVYLLCDLLTFNPIQIQGMARLSTWLESLKRESSAGLISLFQKLPSQRHFILDELLYRLDTLPTNRVQKKLQKVDNRLFATHLYVSIIRMLQSINSTSYRPKPDDVSEQTVDEFLQKFKEQQMQLSLLIEHVNQSVISKSFMTNATKRYILDNYVQDLTAMVVYPSWSIAESLLASLLKMMLLIFSPSNQNHSVKEASVLQVITSIGSVVQEIKLKGKEAGGLTLASIHKSPQLLNTVLTHFNLCSSSQTKNNDEHVSLWERRMACLVALSDVEESGSELEKMTTDAIAHFLKENLNDACEEDLRQDCDSVQNGQLNYFAVLQTSELVNLFDPYVKLVLSLLDKQKAKLKSGAIKCLGPLIAKDPELLTVPSVRNVIEQQLRDSSPSVKSAILDLLGSVHFSKLYRLINLNFDDESTLVRKQVLRLNLEIYDSVTDVSIKAFVASRILRRTEDEEDTIIEKAQTSLTERWFLARAKEDTSVEDEKDKLGEVILTISAVVGLEEDGSQLFDNFLNEYVLNEALHERETFDEIIASTRRITCRIVDDAINSHYNSTDELCRESINMFHLLSIVAACDQAFITKDHITTLYPYLLSSERSGLQFYILKVFNSSFSKLSYFKPAFLVELESVILGRLPKMSVREMEEALPLAWSIACHRNNETRISKACSSCLALLSPYINSSGKGPTAGKPDGKLQRLLYLAAGFARFCNFKNTPQRFPHLKTREPIFEYVTKCILVFTRPEVGKEQRRIALRNLLKIGTAYPKLFNSARVLEVIDKELAMKNLETNLVVIQCLCDFFINEERKTLKLTRPVRYSTLKYQRSKSFDADRSSDAISSAVATRYLKVVLEISLLEDSSQSCIGLRYIELVLDFGYTNPAKCISTIMALTGSPHNSTRKLALTVMENAFMKNTSMLFGNLSTGMKCAIEHAKWLQDCGFSSNTLFLPEAQVVLSNVGMKHSKFFNSLKKALNAYLTSTKGPYPKDQIIAFCFNIAALTFEGLYEVCSLARFLDNKAEDLFELYDRHEDNDMMSPSSATRLMVARECLLELRMYLCQKFGVTDENVAAVGTYEQDELKARPAEPKKAALRFVFPPVGFDAEKLAKNSSSRGI
ncbi:LAME_0E04016g1_1 [Lachancea meyersii CBS 8951]|uniref:Sister chromatid cohesion protein n=1 Tax=Lachancea meyersii CBS 8951 TaxID=1266667 RepID=A0A1G4JGN8_9SACH|nr:LAME_0E04016g1_1 [Lachancea meyersii CBS 8951]